MSVWSELVSWSERALGIIGAGERGRRDIMIRQTLAPAQLSEHLRPRNLCSASNFNTAAKFSLNSESICDIWSPPTERDCNPNFWSLPVRDNSRSYLRRVICPSVKIANVTQKRICTVTIAWSSQVLLLVFNISELESGQMNIKMVL